MKLYTIKDDEPIDTNSFPFQLPLHALYASRDIYENYPPFQREQVWPDRFKYELIDSLVRGAYIPDILITAMPGNPRLKWVLDGQQRLSVMLEFMAALEADTAHRPLPKHKDGSEYFYFRLNKSQQDRIRMRMVKFTEIQNASDDMLSTTFLRLQNQISLTTAEKLWASPSALRNVACEVYTHPFFEALYDGRTQRRQTFQMAIYPAVIEMFKPFADMPGSRLKDLAAGSRSDLVYAGMADVVRARLDMAQKLFDGCKISAMSETVILCQAIWLLDFIGADFARTRPGALVGWYHNVEHLNDESRAKGFMNLFAQFTGKKVQCKWWSKWLDEIVYGGMVELKDEQKSLAALQRFTGWLRHDGICPSCNAAHTRLVDVEKHVFRPADAHLTRTPECLQQVPQLRVMQTA